MPRHERTFAAMGSSFYICLDTSMEDDYVKVLMDKLVDQTEQLEQRMSRFRVDSELVQLNHHLMMSVKVSSTIREVLELASIFNELSSGAFDARVVPGLEGIGYMGAHPDPQPVDNREVVQPQSGGEDATFLPLFDVVAEPNQIRLFAPVDFGGIGKGYTADRLADLIEASVDPVLRSGYIVDAGGDIVISGQQETGEGFAIGIEDPFGSHGELAAALQLPALQERMAICTSSLKRRSWEHGGAKVHHILDPRRQAPARTHLKAVTAVGGSAAYTEVFTKCTMIAEGAKSYPWRGIPLPYVAIDDGLTLHYTADIAPLLNWISVKYQDARVIE